MRLEFPCLFNETVRAKKNDTKPPLLPHGFQIPSGAQTTDPCSESVFVQSNAHGRRTLQRAVMKPTIEYSSAAFWHVPSFKPPKPQNSDSMKMIGEEAKGKSKSTLLNDGSWMGSAPDWIKENFHLRFVEVEQGDPLYNSKVDTRALALAGPPTGTPNILPSPTDTDADTDAATYVCTMGPMEYEDGMFVRRWQPVLQPKDAPPPKPVVFFIAQNRFGYLPHVNTHHLQLTRVARIDLQHKSLANRRAFDDLIKRLLVSEHSQFLRRLSQIEQWPDLNFTSRPPKPPSTSTLPLGSLPHYSREQITNAF